MYASLFVYIIAQIAKKVKTAYGYFRLFLGVEIKLGVGDGELVSFESSHDNAEGVAANLEAVYGFTSEDDLVIKRGGIELGDSLVVGTIDTGVTAELLDDFADDFLGLLDF